MTKVCIYICLLGLLSSAARSEPLKQAVGPNVVEFHFLSIGPEKMEGPLLTEIRSGGRPAYALTWLSLNQKKSPKRVLTRAEWLELKPEILRFENYKKLQKSTPTCSRPHDIVYKRTSEKKQTRLVTCWDRATDAERLELELFIKRLKRVLGG